MKPLAALATTLLTAAAFAQEATLTIPAEPPGGTAYQRVKRLLPPHVGCAVMVLGRDADGQPVEFKRGYGVRALSNTPADDQRVTPTSNFRVSSFTKVLTAAAVLRLVEAGELSLEDSLRKWLPGTPASMEMVTIRSMLDHTSGLPAYHQRIQEGRIKDCSDLVVLRAVTQGRLDFPPGAQCSYSNSAYVLLGLVVQQASGRPFHDYLRDEVLLPLGMEHSVLLVEGLNDATERAYGHETQASPIDAVRRQLENAERVRDQLARAGADRAAAFELQVAQLQERLAVMEAGQAGDPNWRPFDQGAFTRLGGDGALYTCLDDLQALFDAIERRALPLSDELYDLWLEPQREPTDDRFADKQRGRQYASGWMIDERLGEPRYSHRGSTKGFRQTIQWMPESGRAVVVLMNSAPPGPSGNLGWDDGLMEQLGERILRTVLTPPDDPLALESLSDPIELRD